MSEDQHIQFEKHKEVESRVLYPYNDGVSIDELSFIGRPLQTPSLSKSVLKIVDSSHTRQKWRNVMCDLEQEYSHKERLDENLIADILNDLSVEIVVKYSPGEEPVLELKTDGWEFGYNERKG